MFRLRLSSLYSTPLKFTFERSLFTSFNDLGRNQRQFEGRKKREKKTPSPSPIETKILKVSILGTTNSGKSTLINKLMGQLVCPESMKPNTTRTNARAILTQEEKQVVFLDTPGVLDTDFVLKCKIENSILLDPEKSCRDADLLLILHDVSNRYVREAINMKILRLLALYYFKCPSILVLNKMDTIPKSRRVYDLIRKLTCNRLEGVEGEVTISKDSKRSVEKYLERKTRSSEGELMGKGEGASSFSQILSEARRAGLTEEDVSRLTAGLVGWPGFREVFTISALNGDGVPDLKEYLLGSARPGKWRYPEGLQHDGDTKQVVLNIIKSRFLDHLPNVIPYKLVPEIQMWEIDDQWNRLQIVVTVDCHEKNIFKLVIGKKGSKINKISEDIRQCLTNFFAQEVFFKLSLVPKFTYSLENQNEKKPSKPTIKL